MKVLVLNGPNINMLGYRDHKIYGSETYETLEKRIRQFETSHDWEIKIVQSNHEGVLIDEIQNCLKEAYQAIVINPGAYSHYSYAIRDALEMIDFLKVEVHISDIYQREAFRRTSVISDVCQYHIIGRGITGYIDALEYIEIHKNMDK